MPQTTGLKRTPTDKYYTAPHIVQKCIDLIQTNIHIGDNDICIEPSAGDGAFMHKLQTIFNHCRFYDLDPEHSEVSKQDFLTFDYDTIIGDGFDGKHVIGNPPFGRQSSLAIKFIKKAAEFCDSISFILPKSFKKDSLRKHFPLTFHMVHECDLPENAFLVNGESYDVPCVFQIWVKKQEPRETNQILRPIGYEFVKKEDKHDISFRRVGVNAGAIDKNTAEKSWQSHYFIKFAKTPSASIIAKLAAINYTCKINTVGPRSISKQELIAEFNKIIK